MASDTYPKLFYLLYWSKAVWDHLLVTLLLPTLGFVMVRASFSALFVVALSLSGCGTGVDFKTVPASGILTMDGAPVEGAGVTFMSKEKNRVAEGKTDASGRFTLKTVVGKIMLDGAVVGAHKVSVAKTENTGKGAEKVAGESDREMVGRMAGQATNTSGIKQKFIIPEKFNSPEYSGLTADVPEGGTKDIEIKVTSK